MTPTPIQQQEPHPNSFADTTLQQAQANTLFAAQQMVDQLNGALKTDYLTAFSSWSVSVVAGRKDNADPPKPPNAYVVGYYFDPTNLAVKWAYPAVGDKPVCDMPPVPGVVKHEYGEGKIGKAIPGGGGVWFQALDGDATPDAKVVAGVSADGVAGLYKRVVAPVGLGWFEKIG